MQDLEALAAVKEAGLGSHHDQHLTDAGHVGHDTNLVKGAAMRNMLICCMTWLILYESYLRFRRNMMERTTILRREMRSRV